MRKRLPEKDFDFDHFLQEHAEAIAIDKNALDDEFIHQGELFHRVSDRLAITISMRDEKKDYVRELEASTDQTIRSEALENDERMTEAQIKQRITLDRGVQAANAQLAELNRQVNRLAALKESFIQRSHALRELNALYLAGYYGVGTGSHKGARNAANAQYELNREAMQRERKRKM